MDSAPTDLAYAAGVIDSDGYIGVRRSTYGMRVLGDCGQAVYGPRVVVKQVTLPAIDLLQELFGGAITVSRASAARGRPLHAWEVHSAAAGVACRALLPYLRIKSAQAQNAVEVAEINREGRRRRWDVPAVIEGEPMVTMAEAARRLAKSYDTVIQSVRHGNVPHVRLGPRRVLIPESYLPVWAARGHSPSRHSDVTDRLEACYQRAKELNHVGV
jgi:excisionase family DNA binding protein